MELVEKNLMDNGYIIPIYQNKIYYNILLDTGHFLAFHFFTRPYALDYTADLDRERKKLK